MTTNMGFENTEALGSYAEFPETVVEPTYIAGSGMIFFEDNVFYIKLGDGDTKYPIEYSGGPGTFTNIDLTGTGGNGYFGVLAQSSTPSAPAATGLKFYANASGYPAWRIKNGSDTHERAMVGPLTAPSALTWPDVTSDTLALLAATQALSNKTLGNTNTVTLKDTLFTLQDNADATKLLAFELSSLSTLTTRTLTVQDASGTIALTSDITTATGLAVILAPASSSRNVVQATGDFRPIITKAATAATLTVTNKVLTSNVATLDVGAHSVVAGQIVVVSGVDATFNGTVYVTAVAATTISYNKTAGNVASTPSGGSVAVNQAASLWTAQDLSGTDILTLNANGILNLLGRTNASGNAQINFRITPGGVFGSFTNIEAVGSTSLRFSTNNTLRMVLPSGGGVVIGGTSTAVGALTVDALTAAGVATVSRGITSQTGDLYQARNVGNDNLWGITAAGRQYLTSNTSTTYASVGGSIFDHAANAGNSTTTETDLYSDTIAANTLSTNNDKLFSVYSGTFVNSATATRQLRVYFAGTLIFDSGALAVTATAYWTIEVFAIRVSASVVRFSVWFNGTATSVVSASAYTEVTGLTLSNTNILKITGQAAGAGAATDDIVAKLGNVRWQPAA